MHPQPKTNTHPTPRFPLTARHVIDHAVEAQVFFGGDAVVDPASSQWLVQTTTYERAVSGLVLSVTDPLGRRTSSKSPTV
jgi:hypothetical protein